MSNSEDLLQPEETKFLLNLARQVVTDTANSVNSDPPGYFSDNLKMKLGVFVTLHKNTELRGCIGFIEGLKPLQDAVIEMANSAAFHDPRFAPVTSDEVDDLDIEISVLSPVREIKETNEIVVGKHGLIIEQGFYKGLLLPQVATENNWDKNAFLQYTCRKAGLPIDAWQEKSTKISIFSSDIFSEKEHFSK